ncbi:MAG TPA: cobalamin-binding protein [Thiopseudomonas sp.]|nr:cobalamin-binding protein [Thiopseudomonas sp.]
MSNWRRVVLSGLMLLVTLSQPLLAAERVISLAPSLTEMMLDLHSADKLVGLLDGGPRPEGLDDVPSVGDFAQFEMETLLSLQPDLILYWPGSISAIQLTQLRQLDVPIFTARATTMDELALQFAELGELLGVAEHGAELTAQSQQKLLQMRARYQREVPLRVFYQVWDSPMYTLGGEQIITDALQVCGAQNIYADLKLAAPQVSIESVLVRDPDVILLGSERLAQMWQAWPVLRAVQRQQVLEVPDHGLERPSLQMFAALELLCEHLADFQ